MPHNTTDLRAIINKYRMSDKEISEAIRKKAEENNIHLTAKQGFFALKLFDYGLKHGVLYGKNGKYYCLISLTTMNMGDDFFGYKKSAVIKVLSLMTRAGLISREPYKNVGLNPYDVLVHPNTKATIIDCSLFCNFPKSKRKAVVTSK